MTRPAAKTKTADKDVGKETQGVYKMSIGAVNNPTAFSVYTNYARSSGDLQKSMTRMATGVKSAVDDSAGIAMSERMRAQARSTAMARTNVDNGISVLQTADGWLQRMNDLLSRMHELTIGANDATKTASDKANLQNEFKELQSEVARIGNLAAKFNGKSLFDTTFAAGVQTQAGADSGQTITIKIADLRQSTGNTSIAGGSMTWQEILTEDSLSVASSSALNDVQSAIDFVSTTRATIGGQQSRFENTRTGLLTYEENIRTAESKIRDVDMARESSEMVKSQILSQVGNAMLAQANQLPQSIVQLVG